MQVYPITGSPFQCEATPGSNGVSTLQLVARDGFNLDGAGFNAVLAQISGYLTSAKCVSILRLTNDQTGVAVAMDVSGCSYTVLTADISGQVSALASIVQTAADVNT